MLREYAYWEAFFDEFGEDSDRDDDSDDSNSASGDGTPDKSRKMIESPKTLSDELLKGLISVKEDEKFFDVTIISGAKRIKAHKVVLCAVSPYFNAMFAGSFVENACNEVILQDLNTEHLEMLINYMYSGNLPFTSDNVDQVLLTAQFLQIDSAIELCLKHIMSQTSIKNCINLLCFAGKHSLKSLCQNLIEYIVNNFHTLVSDENFNQIEFIEFKKIVTHKKVCEYPPDIQLSVILRWINYNYEKRKEHLTLLTHLNPQHVTKSFLHSKSLLKNLSFDLFKSWYDLEPLVDEKDPANWDIAIFRYTGKFTPELLKLNSSATTNIKDLPNGYIDGSFVSHGGAIYHTGGCLSKKPVTKETYCFSIYRNLWKTFIQMNKGRAYHRNCIVDTNLYSIGGTDGGYSAFSSCEYIDLVAGRSININDLNKPREQMGLTVHQNVIYAVGGKNRGKCNYRCAEMYDPRVGKWEMLNTISYESGISSCVTIDDDIYCLTMDESLERYDIRGNFWTKIITQYKSYPVNIFSINNQLYGLFKSFISKYKALEGKWDPPLSRFEFSSNNTIALPILIAPKPFSVEIDDVDQDDIAAGPYMDAIYVENVL